MTSGPMRFFYADAQDYIDPGFNFLTERNSEGRMPQHDDVYPHEFFDPPPYDGVLISRAIVGDEKRSGKYSTSQMIRFMREGARKFLRYDPAPGAGTLMGDCGAFSYLNEEEPPFSVDEVIDYYEAAGFTLGVSIDHVVLGYDERLDREPPMIGDDTYREWVRRYDLTLRLAEEFLARCGERQVAFEPMGVAQGWGPLSYRRAVAQLADQGYTYVALGGLVPLRVDQIHRVLQAVREECPDIRLHLFGFTKADNIAEFTQYQLTSFDSTSPLLRAFKDGRKNYLLDGRWYTALRVPSADDSVRFKGSVLAGVQEQRELRRLECAVLTALRDYDAGKTEDVDAVVATLGAYERVFSAAHADARKKSKALADTEQRLAWYRETLTARPWAQCTCRACREAGIEVVIFRGSNRNRRRGFHNLQEFHGRLKALRGDTEVTSHAV